MVRLHSTHNSLRLHPGPGEYSYVGDLSVSRGTSLPGRESGRETIGVGFHSAVTSNGVAN